MQAEVSHLSNYCSFRTGENEGILKVSAQREERSCSEGVLLQYTE